MSVLSIKKHKWKIITAFVLIALYFFTRLVSLTQLPIFVDEAIYLRWAQIAKNDANWRFISLTDGKQPLYVWLTMVMMKLIKDPMVAGRFVSVLAGLGSMITIWVVSHFLFKSYRLAFLAAFLYLIFPFALVYDRMALMETTVGFFSVLSLLFGILLVKTLRLDVTLLLGGVLGGGILTKTSGFLSIYFLPLTLFLFDWKDKKRLFKLLKWAGLALLAVIISQAIYCILRLSPFFHIISQKDAFFVHPFKEWITHPFYFLKSNFQGLFDWLIGYLTWPLFLLAIGSLILVKQKIREKILLFLWFLAPFSGLVVFGKTLYPRFIFFMALPLLILVAWSLEKIFQKIKKAWLFALVCLLFLAWPLSVDFQLLFYPSKASIPQPDKEQYITSWPAGYGVKEIVAFANKKAKDGKIFIATEGTFGLMPASLELYLWDHPNVEIKGFFPVEKIPEEVLEKAKIMPTYFVFNETIQVPGNFPLKLIAEYPRPDPRYSMRLYQVLSSALK